MKFTLVVVMLAMALAAEASVITWAKHGHPEWSAWGNKWHGAWDDGSHHHGAWDHGHHHDSWAAHDTHGISLSQGHHGHGHHGSHGISLSQGHGHHYAPAHVHHAHHDHHDHHGHHYDHHHHHDAHYVAKTLGAVHTAPLPGHIDSVKSINVAHAPGTH